MTTTAQAFDNFIGRISLTDAQKAEVTARRTKTEGYLRGKRSLSRAPCQSNESSSSDLPTAER